MDSMHWDLGEFASFSSGRNVTSLRMHEVTVEGALRFANDNKYGQFAIESQSRQGVHLVGSIGGEASNRGVFEVYEPGTTDLSGRYHAGPGWGFGHGLHNKGLFQGVSFHGLNPTPGKRHLAGDEYRAGNFPPSWPQLYSCVQGGFYGTDSYEKLVGIPLESLGGQQLRTQKPSDFIKFGDTFFLRGVRCHVTHHPGKDTEGR
jgi:hypothetical protein